MENNRPIAKFRDGLMEIAVWRNQNEERERYNLTLRRSYKDSSDQWVERTFSLNDRDIARCICLLSEGYHSVLTLKNA